MAQKLEEQKTVRKAMPFLDHLEELRWRILKALIAVFAGALLCFFLSDRLVEVLVAPARSLSTPPKLIFLKPVGMFLVRLEASLVGGILLGLPVVLYQMWAFVVPGLFERERRTIPALLVVSILCFSAGVLLAYFVVIPIALRFMIGMATDYVEPQFDIGRYISFILRLLVAFGVVFELPVFSYFFSSMGILTPRFLRRNRRYAVVVIVVLAAVITPPDVVSQILMAGPLLLLYEASILVSAAVHRKGRR
ncbi:MAG: twin-arginine translocase subunit TatC [Candidatus Latescibacteria bacterium]|nr:twin-arginine translocase subunit TatC [Candidatus Latescibacterota bacterium]